MKALSSTYVFKHYDKQINLQKSISELVSDGKVFGEDEIGDSIAIIRRSFNFLGKDNILNYYDAKKVIPLYNPNPNFNLPIAIPAFAIKTAKGTVGMCNITNFTTYAKKSNLYNTDERKLYTHLQMAYLLVKMSGDNMNAIRMNKSISDTLCSLYAYTFMKVINKAYRINADDMEADKVLSAVYRFCGVNMLELPDNEVLLNYASKLTRSVSPQGIKLFNSQIATEDMRDINTFIAKLSEVTKGLGQLTVSNFLEGYIKMFGLATIFGVEYMPYFIYNLFAVYNGAFINNQYALENVIERDIDKLYANIMSSYR